MHTFVKRILSWVTGAIFAGAAASSCLAGVTATPSEALSARLPRAAGVLPALVRPYGYSLHDMARLTAAFNVDHTQPMPNTPFQILYNADPAINPFRVAQGAIMYVPVAYDDDSVPVIGNFPRNVEDRRQLLRYWYSQREWGSVYMDIVIDGKVFPLGPSYLASVRFDQALPDGAKQYITPAAFVGPLSVGMHTVEIRLKATGDAFREDPILVYFPDGFFEFSVTYNVQVF